MIIIITVYYHCYYHHADNFIMMVMVKMMMMMMMRMSVNTKKMLKQGCGSYKIYVNRSQACYLPLGINQVLLQLSSLI